MNGSRFAMTAVAVTAFSAVVHPGKAASDITRYDDHKLVVAEIASPGDLAIMSDLEALMLDCEASIGPMTFVVPPESMIALASSGIAYELVDENVQDDIDAETARLQAADPIDPRAPRISMFPWPELIEGWFEDYKSYWQILGRIYAWEDDYPELVDVEEHGETLDWNDSSSTEFTGHPVLFMRVGREVGNPDKPTVLLVGGQHAREWIGIMVGLYIADVLITEYDRDPEIRALVDAVEFVFVPVANPNGYQHTWIGQEEADGDRLWRKNRHRTYPCADDPPSKSFGVDINRNWDAHWLSGSDPCNIEYPGSEAFSEAETAVIENYVSSEIPQLAAVIDLHSFAQNVRVPYGYQQAPPPEDDDIIHRTLADGMADRIFSVHGETYLVGSSYEFSPLPINGTFRDWAYDEGSATAFTIELRPETSQYNENSNFILPPEEIIPNSEEILPATLFLGSWVAGDYDGDGVPSFEDNCPGTPNAWQDDNDGDGRGDACDKDRDVYFYAMPTDITEVIHAAPGDKVVSTGRARVSVQALEQTGQVVDVGSDIELHWCDCDTYSTNGAAAADGSGAASFCATQRCPWNNFAGIILEGISEYYPISYSKVYSPADPPGVVFSPIPSGDHSSVQDLAGYTSASIVMTNQEPVVMNPASPTCEVDIKEYTGLDNVTHTYEFCRQLDDRAFARPPAVTGLSLWPAPPPGQKHDLIWHWRDEEWWADEDLGFVSGFLWSRAGWNGGNDFVSVQETTEGLFTLHERTQLTNDDGWGAWSRGYSPFAFGMLTLTPQLLPAGRLAQTASSGSRRFFHATQQALRGTPILGWIPPESAALFDLAVKLPPSMDRPGVSATAGVTVWLVGRDIGDIRLALNEYPSREDEAGSGSPADARDFSSAAFWRTGTDGATTPVVAVFGGSLADGTYDDRLFIGELTVTPDGLPLAKWKQIRSTPGTAWPAGRVDAILAFREADRKLVLAGGGDGDGARNDIWIFDQETALWEEVNPLPFPAAGAATAMRGGDVLYVFGGETGGGVDDGLFALDLTTGIIDRVALQPGGPGPRMEARMTVEGGGTLLVMGGVDPTGVHRNDLWRVDPRSGSWLRLKDDCSGAGCPVGEASALLVSDEAEPMVVGGYTGSLESSAGRQLRRGRWITPDEVVGVTPAAKDCNADGVADEGYGVLCRIGTQWWTPVGRKICGEGGDLTCDAMSAAIEKQRQYWTVLPWTFEEDLERGFVYVMGWNWIDVVRVVRGQNPSRVVRLHLGGFGYDMALDGDRLYVGSMAGLEVFDVSDPQSAFKESMLSTGSDVYEVSAGGGRLLILDDDGVKIVRPPGERGGPPVVMGLIPAEEFDADEPWFACTFGFAPPGRLLAAGDLGFVSGDFGLWVLDVEDPSVPEKNGYTFVGLPPGELRISDRVVYASGLMNVRFDVRDPDDPVVILGHDVRQWVMGREVRSGTAVRLVATGLQIAELRRVE